MEIILGGIIGIVVGALYFLPTLIAIKNRDELGIPKLIICYTVNTFLGWTIIGWIFAFGIAMNGK